jgi:hypothetical protein
MEVNTNKPPRLELTRKKPLEGGEKTLTCAGFAEFIDDFARLHQA